ncbi:relaxase [Psychrobacter sp. APC 3350]|uniref:relaxase n=1 Tax=Psychrobacter sp. APC 3350 TaxID=3035195 RepID=UPI0025B313DB|nr:relaxase [Psychrobacter sp. APC 3350]MDN3454607.1 relaxase [Psychrobacter sp. APC 3350]
MIVKFFRRSKGQGSKPINYFLGAEKDREFARVLSGDPDITEHLINATKFENKYTSGVLSFTERVDEISEADKLAIMRSFEKTLFPGLEPDQYDILWIEHSDKDRFDVDSEGKQIRETERSGRLELNFVIPCHELRTGKRLQPFYAGTDLRRVNAWKNIINREVRTVDGQPLTDPNDPKRHRKVNRYLGTAPKPSPFDLTPKKTDKKGELDLAGRDELRASIHRYMLARLSERNSRLENRKAILHELTIGLDLILENTANKSITISHPLLLDKNQKPLRIRLEGGIYNKDFTPEKFTAVADEKYDNTRIRRQIKDDNNYKVGMEIKTEQNRELYKDAVAPLPLDIVVKPPNTDKTAPQRTDTPLMKEQTLETPTVRTSLLR